ncbi:MAG: hypothetical protein V3U75_01810 [Methylococcaceae bacterium]
MTIPTLLTVKQFNLKHPAFPVGGLRHRIFHAKQNGLDAASVLVRNGRRILINEERFFEWLTGGEK